MDYNFRRDDFGQIRFPNAFHDTFVIFSEDFGVGTLTAKSVKFIIITRESAERNPIIARRLNEAVLREELGFLERDFTKGSKKAKLEAASVIVPKALSERLKSADKLELVNEKNPTETKVISNEKVKTGDDQDFESLAVEIQDLFESALESEKAEKEEKKEKKAGEKFIQESTFAPAAPPRAKGQLGSRQRDAEAMYLERQSEIETSLRKSAAKHRKEERERKREAEERDELKRRVLKDEIRSEEITKSEIKGAEQRSNLKKPKSSF